MSYIKPSYDTGSVVDPYAGAQRAVANISTLMKNAEDIRTKKALLAEQQKKDALALKQQQFENNLATQNAAIQEYNAQANGYGQGKLVADAMKNIYETGAVDNINAIDKLNKAYLEAGTDPRMEELVGRLDKSVAYNEAMKGINGNKELTPELAAAGEEAVKRGVLGKDYDLYKKLTDAARSNVEALNKSIVDNGFSDLYKTADANAVKSALYDQLVKGGVNPVYADKVAERRASQYLLTAPGWSETEKQKIAMWDKELASLNKNTTTTTYTTGNGSSKDKSSKKTYYSSTAPETDSIMKAVGSVAKFAGVDNSWFNGENELKDAPKYAAIGAQPIRVKNKKGVETTVYASPDEVAAALLPLTKTNYIAGNQFGSLDAFKKALQKQVQGDYELNNYSPGGGHGSKTTSSTEKRIAKPAQQRIDEINKLKTALINAHRKPTGQEIVDRILGTKNGKRADIVDLSSLYTKPAKVTKKQEKKTGTNALLAALNSPKKGEVARVTAAYVNDLDKPTAMTKGLSDRDKKRLEKVVNSKSTQALLTKLLNPVKRSGTTKSKVGTEVPDIFKDIKIANKGAANSSVPMMGIPDIGTNGVVNYENNSTPSNLAELNMRLRKRANERAAEMGDFPIEYKDSQGVTRMSDVPNQGLEDVSLEVAAPLALALKAPAARVAATMRDLIGKGFTKAKAEYLIRTGQVKLLPRAPQQINVPSGGFGKANLRYNIGIPAVVP